MSVQFQNTVVSLRHRRFDWIFIVGLSLMSLIAVMVAPYLADPAGISSDSAWPGERLAAWYAALDPAVQNREPFITSQVTISMWFLSGFCAVLALGFARGWNGIRTPAVVFAGASMAWVADWVGTLSIAYPGELGEGRSAVLAVHLTFVAFDLGLVYRFWRDDPFGANVPS